LLVWFAQLLDLTQDRFHRWPKTRRSRKKATKIVCMPRDVVRPAALALESQLGGRDLACQRIRIPGGIGG
jgi:hypothetical protein